MEEERERLETPPKMEMNSVEHDVLQSKETPTKRSETLEKKERLVLVHRELKTTRAPTSSSTRKSTFDSERRSVVTTIRPAPPSSSSTQEGMTEMASLTLYEKESKVVVREEETHGRMEFQELKEQVIRLEEHTLERKTRRTKTVSREPRDESKKEVHTLDVRKEVILKENQVMIMSQEVTNLCLEFLPNKNEEKKREKFVNYLSNAVQRLWPDAGLELYGSMANQLGHRGADIDACLIFKEEMIESRAKILTKLARYLRSARMENVFVLKHARVPIVKFTDPVSSYSCDICCENRLAIHNTRLLKMYSLIDPRSRSLMLLVKYWAKQRRINESSSGTLSSYAYVLMVIHFLQSRRPQILPCLQMIGEPREVHLVDGCNVSFFESIEQLPHYGFNSSDNTESMGYLVFEFFKYYATIYDYQVSVISVRSGSLLSRSEKEWLADHEGRHRYTICIEDPFDVTHNLGRVVSRVGFRIIRNEFTRAHRLLLEGQSMAQICSDVTRMSLDDG